MYRNIMNLLQQRKWVYCRLCIVKGLWTVSCCLNCWENDLEGSMKSTKTPVTNLSSSRFHSHLMSPTHIRSETLRSPTYAPTPEAPSTATPIFNSLALTHFGVKNVDTLLNLRLIHSSIYIYIRKVVFFFRSLLKMEGNIFRTESFLCLCWSCSHFSTNWKANRSEVNACS